MKKVYLLSWGAQKPEIDHFCFGECKQIVFGMIEYMDVGWGYCMEAECPHKSDEKDFGIEDIQNPLGRAKRAHIIVRKLKWLEGRDPEIRKKSQKELEDFEDGGD